MEKTTRVLLGLNGGFWLLVGVLVAMGVLEFGLGAGAAVVVGGLSAANGLALALFARFVLRGHRLVDLAAIALVGLNAILTFTDQFGFADAVAFAVNAATAALLVALLVRSSRDARAGQLARGPEPEVRP